MPACPEPYSPALQAVSPLVVSHVSGPAGVRSERTAPRPSRANRKSSADLSVSRVKKGLEESQALEPASAMTFSRRECGRSRPRIGDGVTSGPGSC